MMKNTKKGKVWGTIFYSLTMAVTYVGFVGIETKAAEIKKVEDKISKVVEQAVNQPQEIKSTEPIVEETKAEIKNNPIILAYIKGEKSSGYFSHKDSVYFYVVDENLKVSIYNRYGVVQNEKDFTYELKAVSKEEKEKLTLDELKRSAQVQNDYQNIKEIEKKYAEAHSFVEKRAAPREGLQAFFGNFIRAFDSKTITTNDTLISARLKFIVEKDGSFSNIIAVGGGNETAATEAIRVLQAMPKWQPAENEGQVVRSTFTLPIKIKINQPSNEVEN